MYTRHTWTPGDQPTAARLNNVEAGITTIEADAAADAAKANANEASRALATTNLATASAASDAMAAAAAGQQTKQAQNICILKGTNTGAGLYFLGSSIVYQPYQPLFDLITSSPFGLSCLKAGTYFLECNCFLKNTNGILRWMKNGALISEIARVYTSKSTAIGARVMGFGIVTLAVGDVIRFEVTRSSVTTDTGTNLNAHLYKIA